MNARRLLTWSLVAAAGSACAGPTHYLSLKTLLQKSHACRGWNGVELRGQRRLQRRATTRGGRRPPPAPIPSRDGRGRWVGQCRPQRPAAAAKTRSHINKKKYRGTRRHTTAAGAGARALWWGGPCSRGPLPNSTPRPPQPPPPAPPPTTLPTPFGGAKGEMAAAGDAHQISQHSSGARYMASPGTTPQAAWKEGR